MMYHTHAEHIILRLLKLVPGRDEVVGSFVQSAPYFKRLAKFVRVVSCPIESLGMSEEVQDCLLICVVFTGQSRPAL